MKENIKIVYFVYFLMSMMRHVITYFKCNAGLRVPRQLEDFTLKSFSMAPSEKLLEKLGYFLGLDKYSKHLQKVV